MHPTLAENQNVNGSLSLDFSAVLTAVPIVANSMARQMVSNVLEKGRESITIVGQELASSKFGTGTPPLELSAALNFQTATSTHKTESKEQKILGTTRTS
jgi:hypothetical protein